MKEKNILQGIADALAAKCYGISLSDAQSKQICIQCRQKVGTINDEEILAGYEISGLCERCQKEVL